MYVSLWRSCFFRGGTGRGVLPSGSRGFGSTFRASNSRTTGRFPELAAVCSTVERLAWERASHKFCDSSLELKKSWALIIVRRSFGGGGVSRVLESSLSLRGASGSSVFAITSATAVSAAGSIALTRATRQPSGQSRMGIASPSGVKPAKDGWSAGTRQDAAAGSEDLRGICRV